MHRCKGYATAVTAVCHAPQGPAGGSGAVQPNLYYETQKSQSQLPVGTPEAHPVFSIPKLRPASLARRSTKQKLIALSCASSIHLVVPPINTHSRRDMEAGGRQQIT
jgi:hypothetical protein